MDYSDDEDDNIRRGENEDMDDLGGDESDEEESGNDDDEEDQNDDGIESEEEEEEEEEVHDGSVHKFIRTFHNGDYDQEFVNALSSDRAVPLLPPGPRKRRITSLIIGEKGIELDYRK